MDFTFWGTLDLNGAQVVMVIVVAVSWLFLFGTAIHEGGHWLAAKAFGLGQAKLLIFPHRQQPATGGWINFFNRHAAPAALDWPPDEFLALPVWQRRIIILGGVTADVLVAAVAWHWIGLAGLEKDTEQGLMLGIMVRATLGVLLNLIPSAAKKNDGWRFLHPEAAD